MTLENGGFLQLFNITLSNAVLITAFLTLGFGWGAAMAKKQDKSKCEKSHSDTDNSITIIRETLIRLEAKIENLQMQIDILNRVEKILGGKNADVP
jgi:hypothetical protein